jgi:hypothetical protein
MARRYGVRYQTVHMELDKKLQELTPVVKTHDWNGPTITRDQLIEITERTIEVVNEEYVEANQCAPLTEDEIAACMSVARNAHFITGSWESSGKNMVESCGCLIGTLRIAQGLVADPSYEENLEALPSEALAEVAEEFPIQLGDVMGEHDYETSYGATYLVVD